MAVQLIQQPLPVNMPQSSLHFHVNCSSSLSSSAYSSLQTPRSTWGERINRTRVRASMPLQGEIPTNAFRRKQDPLWRAGFSLGVDLGLSRTGLALSKGFSVRPLTVLNLRGQKLELRIIEIAEKEEVDEFIIGLPKSSDGKETPQSNIVRSIAGRLAARAAERGWRVYLQDEYSTSVDAMNRMINLCCLRDITRNLEKKPNLYGQSNRHYKKRYEKVPWRMLISSKTPTHLHDSNGAHDQLISPQSL